MTNTNCLLQSKEMKLPLLILAFLISTNMVGQTDSVYVQNSIHSFAGINQVKEQNLHPKVHKGAVFGFNYMHEKIKKNISLYDVWFQYSKVKTSFENSSTSLNIQINGRYRYLFEIINKDKLSFFTGPNLSAHYRLSHYPNWDDSHLYWADDFSIGSANKLTYSLSKKTAISFDLGFSLLSVFNRPELNRMYKIDDVSPGGIVKNMNSNFEIGTLNKAFKLDFQVEYKFRISPYITEAICYSFDYGRFKGNEGNPFSNVQHNLGLKIYF